MLSGLTSATAIAASVTLTAPAGTVVVSSGTASVAVGNPPALTTLHADGTVRDWTVNDGGVGEWEPTGERGLASTMLYPLVDPEAGFVGVNTVRIIGEVSEDGQTSSGTFTLEFPTEPEGVFPPPGEWGPAQWNATRIVVEPLGEEFQDIKFTMGQSIDFRLRSYVIGRLSAQDVADPLG